MRTAILAAGWVVAGLLFLYVRSQERYLCELREQYGLAADRLARLDPDPEHEHCQDAVGRLSGELAKESANVQFLARMVAAQHDWIGQLSHEQAIDAGRTLSDEAAQFLADQERGGS